MMACYSTVCGVGTNVSRANALVEILLTVQFDDHIIRLTMLLRLEGNN